MVPVFLQKRRTSRPWVRTWLSVFGLLVLLIGYSLATSFVLADRLLSRPSRMALVAVLLLIGLLSLGALNRLRR